MRKLSDDEAWIVSHNMLLVDFCLRGRSYDDSTRDDLRAAGYLGLCHAIRRYDPQLAQWSTYATYWIRRCIQEEFQSRPIVHVPAYHSYNRTSIKHVISKRNLHTFADRVMGARYVRWDDAEAAGAIAVKPHVRIDDAPEIATCLAELTEEQRTVIDRVVMHGERFVDVARDMGVPHQRVRTIKDLALRQLRLRLAKLDPNRKDSHANT